MISTIIGAISVTGLLFFLGYTAAVIVFHRKIRKIMNKTNLMIDDNNRLYDEFLKLEEGERRPLAIKIDTLMTRIETRLDVFNDLLSIMRALRPEIISLICSIFILFVAGNQFYLGHIFWGIIDLCLAGINFYLYLKNKSHEQNPAKEPQES